MATENTLSIKYNEHTYTGGADFRADITRSIDETNILVIGAPSVGKTWELYQVNRELDDAVMVVSSYQSPSDVDNQVEQLGDEDQVITLADIGTAMNAEFVILDDFYLIVEECIRRIAQGETDIDEILLELLDREYGICVSTTPYRWNTLLGRYPEEEEGVRKGLSTRLGGLSERLSGLVSRFFQGNNEDTTEAVTDSNDEVTENGLREQSVALKEATLHHGGDRTLTTPSVNTEKSGYTRFAETLVSGSGVVKHRFLSYREKDDAKCKLEAVDIFDEDDVGEIDQDSIPEYEADVCLPGQTLKYETYVPFVFFFFEREVAIDLLSEAEESIRNIGYMQGTKLVDPIVNSLRESLPADVSALVRTEQVTGQSGGILLSLLQIATTGGLIGGIGVIIQVAFLIIKQTSEDDPAAVKHVEQTFGGLLDLTPPQMELIERKRGLEPLTLEGFREWTTDRQKREEVRRLVDANRAAIEELKADLGVSLDDLAVFDDQEIADLRESVEAISMATVLHLRIEHALRSPETTLQPDDYEVLTNVPDEWELIPSQITIQIHEAIDEEGAKIIVLQGDSGMGKTTISYQVSRWLRREGYFVATTSLNDIPVIKAVLQSLSRDAVLIFDDVMDLSKDTAADKLGIIEEPSCATLVLTCQTDNFKTLNHSLRSGLRKNRDLHNAWHTATQDYRLTIQGLDRSELGELLSRNFEGLDEQVSDEIWDIARVNDRASPLLAIAAADKYLEHGSLDVTSAEDLLDVLHQLFWHKIDAIFTTTMSGQYFEGDFARLLVYTATAYIITIEDLKSLLRDPDGVDALVNNAPYVHKAQVIFQENQDYWWIRPDLLRLLILRNHCLADQKRWDKIISRLKSIGDDLLYGVAVNLGILYQGEVERRRCTYCAEELLKEIDDKDLYYDFLDIISRRQIPVPPEVVDVQAIVDAEMERSGNYEHGIFAYLVSNHAIGQEDFDTVKRADLLMKEAANRYFERYDLPTVNKGGLSKQVLDRSWLLMNYYSGVYGRIALFGTRKDWRRWGPRIGILIKEAADHPDLDRCRFLSGVYAASLARLTMLSEDEARKDLEQQAIQTARELDTAETERFIKELYPETISMIALALSPEEAGDWLHHIEAQSDIPDADDLIYIYAGALSKITELHDPNDVMDWVEFLEQRAKRIANNQEDTRTNLLDFYTFIITNIANRSDPESARDWLNSVESRILATEQTREDPLFLISVYVESIDWISQSFIQLPLKVSDWIDDFTDRVRILINEGEKMNSPPLSDDTIPSERHVIGESLYQLVFLDLLLSRMVSKTDMDDGQQWFDYIEHEARSVMPSNLERTRLPLLYAHAVSDILRFHDLSDINRWLDYIDDRMEQVAYSIDESDDVKPAMFANYYIHIFLSLAESNRPTELNDQLNLLQSRVEDTAQEVEPMRFLSFFGIQTIVKMTDGFQREPSDIDIWTTELIEWMLALIHILPEGVHQPFFADFYSKLLEELYHHRDAAEAVVWKNTIDDWIRVSI